MGYDRRWDDRRWDRDRAWRPARIGVNTSGGNANAVKTGVDTTAAKSATNTGPYYRGY